MTFDAVVTDTILDNLMDAGIATGVQEDWYYVDEPRYYQFSIQLYPQSAREQVATGAAFSRDAARGKAIFEALERVALTEWKADSSARLEDCTWMLDSIPSLVRGDSELRSALMTPCQQLCPDSRPSMIAAQLGGVPYEFAPNDCVLREPISTGAACAERRGEAILRGCFECIERDQVMTSFYGRVARGRIELDANAREDLRWINHEVTRCGLELCLIDVSSIAVPAVTLLALVVDRSGFGPALTVGAKTGTDPSDVARAAIEEAMQGRAWLRDNWNRLDAETRDSRIHAAPGSFLERGLVWASASQLEHLSFYFSAPRLELSSYPTLPRDPDDTLELLLVALKNAGFSVYVVELSHPIADTVGMSCVKAIIPELQPLFIDERYRILESRRLPANVLSVPTHFFL